MKKILLTFSVILILLLMWYGESRKFFCIDGNRCITVWKTYNNTCYIILGKYYGLFKPSENFIKTTNTNNITIFFSSELPNSIIYRSDYPSKVNSNNKDKIIFYDYNSDTMKFNNLLYLPNAKNNNDIKESAGLMDIFIHDNYAIDKNGKKL